MDADRITGEPGDRQEQGREEPFAGLARINARVKRIEADGAVIHWRNRLIREAAKATALSAAALGAFIVAVSAYRTVGASMSRFEAGMAQFCFWAAVVLGFFGAQNFSKTARVWRAYRCAKEDRNRHAENTDIKGP